MKLHVQIEQTRIITLVIIIMIMLLQLLYRSIFRTLAYLMSQTYSKLYHISKMMRYNKNPGIGRTVYSDIFRHIHGHSTISASSGIFRDIKAYSDIFRHF